MSKKQLFPRIANTLLEDFKPVQNVEELEIIDSAVGQGEASQENSKLKAHYTGALCKNGLIFESSLDNGKPLTFTLHEVIEGWAVGLIGMREVEKGG